MLEWNKKHVDTERINGAYFNDYPKIGIFTQIAGIKPRVSGQVQGEIVMILQLQLYKGKRYVKVKGENKDIFWVRYWGLG